jgi:hypothetical protein
MRHAWMMAFAALLLAVSACSKAAPEAAKKEDADTPGIALSADEIKSMGIATAPATPTQFTQSIKGYGVVTALDTIAQTDADFATAAAAAAQSQSAAARAQSLSTGDEAAVSREVVETAQSKAAADQAALTLARRKADASFGIHAPWQNAAERSAIMARLASGKAVLVRVTFPAGAVGGAAPASLQISRLGAGAARWTAHQIWDAPGDATLPGRSFFALVDGSDLAQNERVLASVPNGSGETGVAVPASALLLSDSQTWVYVQNGDNHFLRTPIPTDKPLGADYFVPNGGGIAAGQKIVTNGAGLLLSREVNPSTSAGD